MAHSTDYYQTGGGILFIAEDDGLSDFDDLSWVDAGNCPELSTQPEIEVLSHSSHRGGKARTDKRVAMSEKITLNFKLDEINEENLKMFFKGTVTGTTIHMLTAGLKEYALKFVPDYAAGKKYKHEYWRISMDPSEALNVINMGEWATLGFTGEVLEDMTRHPTSPFGDLALATD